MIVRDFNPLCWPRAFRLLSQLATEHNLHQLVTFPTQKQSILDLVYVSHHYYTAIVEDLPPVASADHHMIIITLKDCFKQRLQKQYSIIDYAKLDQVLGQVIWHSYFLGCYSVDDYADALTNVWLEAIYQCTYVRSACRRPRLPKYIVSLLQKKKRAWTFYKNSGDISRYLTAQRTAQVAIHQYRRNCEAKLVYSNNKKAFFAHVNRNIKSEPSNIALSVNGVVLSDQEAAGVFLTEFSRNFSAVSNESLSDIMSDFNASQLYFNCNEQIVAEAMHNVPTQTVVLTV